MQRAPEASGLLVLLASWPSIVLAHAPDNSSANLWQQWNFAPEVVIPILLGIGFYAMGIFRLWRRAGVGRGISRSRAAAYGCGIAALIAALASPLDAAASALFSIHMVQHLLLILVAPPLLVIGNPDIALLWALPKQRRRSWGRLEQGLGAALSSGKGQLMAISLATGMLWVWHLPKFYDLALRHEALHWTEHLGFLVSACLFWITILRLRSRDHLRNGVRLLYVFAMALQGSMLGALITFAARPLYESHLATAPVWGMPAIVDQQLAGLIMWVPPTALYMGVSAYLFVSWLDAVGASRRRPPGVTRANQSF